MLHTHAHISGSDEPAAATGRRASQLNGRKGSTAYTAHPQDWRSPVYTLIAAHVVCALYFAVQHHTPDALLLSVAPRGYQWWQLVSSGFAHTSAIHLAENVFMIYTFGRLVERSHGGLGLWTVYLAAVLGELTCISLHALPSRSAHHAPAHPQATTCMLSPLFECSGSSCRCQRTGGGLVPCNAQRAPSQCCIRWRTGPVCGRGIAAPPGAQAA